MDLVGERGRAVGRVEEVDPRGQSPSRARSQLRNGATPTPPAIQTAVRALGVAEAPVRTADHGRHPGLDDVLQLRRVVAERLHREAHAALGGALAMVNGCRCHPSLSSR